jgi:integrase
MARERKVKRAKLPKGFYWSGSTIQIRTDPITGGKKSTGTSDVKLAQYFYAQRKELSLQPAAVAAHSVTVGQAIEEHVAAKKLGKVTPTTVAYIEGKVKPLLRIIGADKPLDEIDAGVFDRYALSRAREAGKRGKGVSGYTIRRELRELASALRRQKRAGKFAGELEELVPEDLQASANKVDRNLSEAECTAFVDALPNQRWRAYFCISVGLGLRKSESLKVGPDDLEIRTEPLHDASGFQVLDADGKPVMRKRIYAHVRGTKTKLANRIVPVLPGFEDLVEYALPNLPLGKMGNEFRTFGAAAKKAQIAHCSPNDFRRSWTTILGTKGVTNEQAAKILGHASITMAATVYNQSKATQIAPVVEGVLARAPAIDIQLPGAERHGRGRKVKPPAGGDPPESPEGSSGGSDGGSDGPASALGAEWQDCSQSVPKTSHQCFEVENRGAPRKIRTCDLWLRRPKSNGSNFAKTHSGSCSSHQQATSDNNSKQQTCPKSVPSSSHLTADADHNSKAENGGVFGAISNREAEARSPDLTVPTHPARTEIEASIPDCDWYGGKFIVPTPSDLEAIKAESAARIRKANEAAEAVIGDPRIIGGGGRYEGSHGASHRREPLSSVPSETDWSAYDRVIDAADREISRAILGESMTLGSYPRGKIPQKPRDSNGASTTAAPRLVRTRANGLREYSTEAGSVWGWS